MTVKIETHTDPTELHRNVMNGVEYLDQHRPGWHRDIDLLVLNQNSVDDCILGQLFGNALQWQQLGDWTLEDMTRHGFWALDVDYSYAQLTDQWRAILEQRLLD